MKNELERQAEPPRPRKWHPAQEYSPPSPLDRRNMRIWDEFVAGATLSAIAKSEGVTVEEVNEVVKPLMTSKRKL